MAWRTELADRLSKAVNGEKDKIIDEYIRLTGKSAATLYRIAGKHGFSSGRKGRDDKGILKLDLTEDQILYVAALIKKTGRDNKGPIMPVAAAMEIAYDAGIIERDACSINTMQRLLRERNLDKGQMKMPSAHTDMRSLHPNYCQLVDVSVCIQYYLKNGKMGFMDERDFYKNKPHNYLKIKQKLLRYVLTDHFSGIFYFRYYAADGETRENLWDFLKECWRAKSDNRLPFRGVPFYMLMDAGCAQTSKAMKNFFQGLQITIPAGMPHNPRKQGSVETIHNLIERWFETKLRICPATSVEELNAWALDFMIWFHATRKHSRTRETRLESWLRIMPEQLRECPADDILNILYTEPEVECPVTGYRLTYRTKKFNLKHLPGMPAKARVMVSLNPYRWTEEGVITVNWQGVAYEVAEIRSLPASAGGFAENAAIIGQEYKAQPENPTQKASKEIELMAYGTSEPKKGQVPFAGTPVFGTSAAKVGNLAVVPRRGTAMDLGIERGPVMLPVTELFKQLRGHMTPKLNKELREKYGESIESAELDRVVHEIIETGGYSHDEADTKVRHAL